MFGHVTALEGLRVIRGIQELLVLSHVGGGTHTRDAFSYTHFTSTKNHIRSRRPHRYIAKRSLSALSAPSLLHAEMSLSALSGVSGVSDLCALSARELGSADVGAIGLEASTADVGAIGFEASTALSAARGCTGCTGAPGRSASNGSNFRSNGSKVCRVRRSGAASGMANPGASGEGKGGAVQSLFRRH